jgi:hypothetical protein
LSLQRLAAILLLVNAARVQATVLRSETAQAFDHYVQLTEAESKQRMRPGKFLWIDQHPRAKSQLWLGQPLIQAHKTLDHGEEIDVPDGLVQDWIGDMFLPGVTLNKVREILQDYANYKVYFKPEVIESRAVKHEGDRFEVFLRLYKKQVLTVVLNTTYSVEYGMLDPAHVYVDSRSTDIREVKDPKKKKYDEEQPAGEGYGFLWRINSYWRFEQADNGVYAELEAVSLSRDIPLGLGFILKGFVERFPQQSMENTMQGLRQTLGIH